MRKVVVKLVNLLALLGAVAWLCTLPGWEPLVTSLVLLAALIGLELSGLRAVEVNPDRELFRAFLRALPYEGSIRFISETDMRGLIQQDRLDELAIFAIKWGDAEHEFQSRKLDRKRKKLMALASEYLHFVGVNTWSERPGWQRVPPEWEIKQPERFHSVVDKLHKLGGEIVDCHQDLVRAARKRLKLTGANTV